MGMKVFSDNAVLGAADVNEYLVNTKFAVKPNNTTRSSAPGFADDPDLVLHTDASKTYQLDLYVQFASPTAAGFDFTFTGAGGNVLYGNVFSGSSITSPAGAAGNTQAYDGSGNLLVGTMSIPSTPGASTPALICVSGILVTAGTAGNFTFRWRQAASNAGNTTVYGGSSMIMRRVA